MNTCGTCAHWGSAPDEHGDETKDDVYRVCGAVIHDKYSQTDGGLDPTNLAEYVEDYGELSAKLQAEIAAIRKHTAVVKDGEGYFAALKTREDFGCVLWRKSEET